jgi:hypothetical protein
MKRIWGAPACDDTESDEEEEHGGGAPPSASKTKGAPSGNDSTRKRFKGPSLAKTADSNSLQGQHSFVYSSLGSAGALSDSDEEQNSPVKIGDVLGGRWNLKERLGKGAFGEVFLASDASGLRQTPVAVKVLL